MLLRGASGDTHRPCRVRGEPALPDAPEPITSPSPLHDYSSFDPALGNRRQVKILPTLAYRRDEEHCGNR